MLDLDALAAFPAAVQRRLIRHTAAQLGSALDFPATETLRNQALSGRSGQKTELAGGLRAERSHRELRLMIQPSSEADSGPQTPPPVEIPAPGAADAAAYGLHVEIFLKDSAASTPATLRNWRAGDRVTLRHSGGPRKVKEVLERLKISGSARAFWPVLELEGRILWMQGVVVEPEPGIEVRITPLA